MQEYFEEDVIGRIGDPPPDGAMRRLEAVAPRAPLRSRIRYAYKRPLDIAVSALALTLGAPVILLIAIAIKLDTRGPTFFRQERVGRRGVRFRIVKFRTMSHGCDEGVHKRHYESLAQSGNGDSAPIGLAEDSRVTRVGAFLRRWSLDEIPNLWNVLLGQMSLVGPRPLVPYEVDLLDDTARQRLIVKPGVTGWAQVNGRLDVTLIQRTNLDVAYVEKPSMWRDVRILMMTIPAIFKRPGG